MLERKKKFINWVEINSKALKNNVGLIKKIAGEKVGIIAVVKSNAYGHGLVEVAKILSAEGTAMFGVNALSEALKLRHAGIKENILVMGYILPDEFKDAIENKIDITLFDEKMIPEIDRAALKSKRVARVHLKFDSGMGRLGIPLKNVLSAINKIKKYPSIKLWGLSSHFACADTTQDTNHLQIKNILGVLSEIQKLKIKIPILHFSNSAMSVRSAMKEFLNQNVGQLFIRPGILLYGMSPFGQKIKMLNDFKPVLSWKTKVIQLKKFPAGHCISYGCTYRTQKNEIIATVSTGYYEGFDRKFSNNGEVLIHGKRAKVRGRVCMDFMMVDVSKIKGVKVGDEVVIIGKSGKEEISAKNLADQIHTINYEITTRINLEIPRIVV
ncbi:MAG: alanine racemase [Patescibacteria group bacterium]